MTMQMSGSGTKRRFVRRTDTVAMGGIADMNGRVASVENVESDVVDGARSPASRVP